MSWALGAAIPKDILIPVSHLTYKPLQNIIMEDDEQIIIERVLRKISPHIGGKVEDLQKQIYDMHIIFLEDPNFFTNRASILHKNMIPSSQDVYPNILIEQLLT